MRKIIAVFILVAIFITACSSSAKTISIPATLPPSPTLFKPTIVPTPTLTPTHVPVGITEIASLGKGSAEFVDWSPDGKLYAIGGSFGVRIFDVKTHSEIKILPHPADVDIRFSPDSQLIGVTSLSDIKIIRISDGRVLSKIGGRGNHLFSVMFSPDSQSFAYILRCYMDCKDFVYIQSVGKSNEAVESFAVDVPIYPGLSFYQVAFDSTGTILYGAASDSTIHVWDVTTGKLKYTLKGHTNEVTGFTFSPDKKLLASYGKDFRVIVWNLVTKQPYRKVVGYKGTIKKLTFSPDGSHLNIIFDDNLMLIRDLATGETSNTEYADSDAKLLQQLRSTGGYIDYIDGLTYSPDGQTLAVSSSGSSPILLWDIPAQKVRATLDARATKLLYSHNGDFLASFDNDPYDDVVETVLVWDTHTNRKFRMLTAPNVASITFSPDDSILAVGTKGEIKFWNISQDTIETTIETKGEWIQFISYSPDGKTISDVSITYVPETNTSVFFVQSWNTFSGKLIHEFVPSDNNLGPLGEIVGYNNNTLAIFKYSGSSSNNKIVLWNINTATQTGVLKGINDYMSSILGYDPSGRVAAVYYNYRVTFYNLDTSESLYTYSKQPNSGCRLAFSPDGKSVAIGDATGNLTLWDVSQIIK